MPGREGEAGVRGEEGTGAGGGPRPLARLRVQPRERGGDGHCSDESTGSPGRIGGQRRRRREAVARLLVQLRPHEEAARGEAPLGDAAARRFPLPILCHEAHAHGRRRGSGSGGAPRNGLYWGNDFAAPDRPRRRDEGERRAELQAVHGQHVAAGRVEEDEVEELRGATRGVERVRRGGAQEISAPQSACPVSGCLQRHAPQSQRRICRRRGSAGQSPRGTSRDDS